MSTEQVTRCDVFRTLKDVKKFEMIVKNAADTSEAKTFQVDLSPRAYARLIRKIEQGTTPPAKRKR